MHDIINQSTFSIEDNHYTTTTSSNIYLSSSFLDNILKKAFYDIKDFVEKKYGENQVKNNTVFQEYFESSFPIINQIRTLATGISPCTIICNNDDPDVIDNSIYVPLDLSYENIRNQEYDTIKTESVENILEYGGKILIIGGGGFGKSTMLKYLFLQSVNEGNYIPILLSLTKFSKLSEISFERLIYYCLDKYGASLDHDQFEYSLNSGKFLFLLDGLDEVPDSILSEVFDSIKCFVSKYYKNKFIVTTRYEAHSFNLSDFCVLKIKRMSPNQSKEFITKLKCDPKHNQSFIAMLYNLFATHYEFVSNPLLLSLSFYVFQVYGQIPNHRHVFYNQCFSALYSKSYDENYTIYNRRFYSSINEKHVFQKILQHFCFASYIKEQYEFSEYEIISELEISIKALGISDVSAEHYFRDLTDSICLIHKDGLTYKFIHRSFQTYFAAEYVNSLSDYEQIRFYSEYVQHLKVGEFLSLLIELNQDRFFKNALEHNMCDLIDELNQSTNREKTFLQNAVRGVRIIFRSLSDKKVRVNCALVTDVSPYQVFFLFQHIFINDFLSVNIPSHLLSVEDHNPIVDLPVLLIAESENTSYSAVFDRVTSGNEIIEIDLESLEKKRSLNINIPNRFTPFAVLRNSFYDAIISEHQISELLQKVDIWFSERNSSISHIQSSFDSLINDLI